MLQERDFIITEHLKGMRLDQALSHFLDSRTQATRLIKQGAVQVSSAKIIKPSYKVDEGDVIHVAGFEAIEVEDEQSTLEPYDYPIPIIFEDDHILVVDKPAGLVVHPSHGHRNDTLVNALIHKLNPEVGSNEKRPGLVHRLDKDVSGLLVLSKSHTAHHFLAKQFPTRQIKRRYLAICYNPIRYDNGRIETFITRHPKDRKKFMASKKEGKQCITLFKVLNSYSKDISLIEFELLTGRTHQARIHSLEISRGILGDETYSPLKPNKVADKNLQEKIQSLHRVALHAAHLKFIHPETKKEVQFESPLPKELQSIIGQ